MAAAKTFSFEDLRERYEGKTALIVAECSLSTELVGGVPADPGGVRMFVQHHLKLSGQEAEEATARMLKEEIGERDVPSEEGELREKLAFGINVIRRDAHGPYLGNWMAKACIKASASRLGIFTSKKGSKGDMAEMGEIRSVGLSLKDGPNKIYLIDRDSDAPAQTYFQEFKGRIQSPQGSKSIVSNNECAPPGTRFSFEYRYAPNKVKQDDIADVFACAMVIGLGSAKSFERGKFSIHKLTFQAPGD